jgi:valyl-tRNA synthetase
VFHRERGTIERLARISQLEARPADSHLGAHAVLRDGTGVFMPAEGVFDVEREVDRLRKEADRLSRAIESQRRKLANEQFTSRAPTEVVQRERDKLKDWSDQLDELTRKRKGLVMA